MKTVVVYVDGLFSVCDALGVEKRLLRHPGIRRAEASYLSGTATVEYDESRVTLADIQRIIGQCGYGCAGFSHGPLMEPWAEFEYPPDWPPARGCRVPRVSMAVPVGILVEGHLQCEEQKRISVAPHGRM